MDEGRGEIPTADAAEAETIRSRHRRDEAFVAAAGRIQYVYGLVVLTLATYLGISIRETSIAIAAARGTMNDRVYWVSLTASIAALGAANILAGYGLRRLRGWAFRAEYAVAASVFLVLTLVAARAPQGVPWREVLVDVSFTSLAASPPLVLIFFLIMGDARGVASPGYRSIVARTRRMRVRPALPVVVRWSLGLVAAGLAALYWAALSTLVRP